DDLGLLEVLVDADPAHVLLVGWVEVHAPAEPEARRPSDDLGLTTRGYLPFARRPRRLEADLVRAELEALTSRWGLCRPGQVGLEQQGARRRAVGGRGGHGRCEDEGGGQGRRRPQAAPPRGGTGHG